MRTPPGQAGFEEYCEQMLSRLLEGSVKLWGKKESPEGGMFPRSSVYRGVNIRPGCTEDLPEEVTLLKPGLVNGRALRLLFSLALVFCLVLFRSLLVLGSREGPRGCLILSQEEERASGLLPGLF